MLEVLNHPLITHKLTQMRNKNCNTKDFRENLDEIAELMRKDEVALITVQAPSQSLKYSTSADAVQVQCINDSEGHLLLPIFTSKHQVSSGGPELYCMTDSIYNILSSSLAADNLFGVVINPFGQNFLLDKKNVRLLVQQFEMDRSIAEKNRED